MKPHASTRQFKKWAILVAGLLLATPIDCLPTLQLSSLSDLLALLTSGGTAA